MARPLLLIGTMRLKCFAFTLILTAFGGPAIASEPTANPPGVSEMTASLLTEAARVRSEGGEIRTEWIHQSGTRLGVHQFGEHSVTVIVPDDGTSGVVRLKHSIKRPAPDTANASPEFEELFVSTPEEHALVRRFTDRLLALSSGLHVNGTFFARALHGDAPTRNALTLAQMQAAVDSLLGGTPLKLPRPDSRETVYRLAQKILRDVHAFTRVHGQITAYWASKEGWIVGRYSIGDRVVSIVIPSAGSKNPPSIGVRSTIDGSETRLDVGSEFEDSVAFKDLARLLLESTTNLVIDGVSYERRSASDAPRDGALLPSQMQEKLSELLKDTPLAPAHHVPPVGGSTRGSPRKDRPDHGGVMRPRKLTH